MASVLIFCLNLLLLTATHGKSISKPPIHGRIVGGEATTIDSYPYQVSIVLIDSHNCGGSIIRENYILTAAHCTDGIPSEVLYIRAGSTMLNTGGQYIKVAEVTQHPQFDSKTLDHDICILKLEESLSLGPGVHIIELPEQSEDDIDADIMGVATGWGRLSEKGPLPMELQMVELPTITRDNCEKVYGKPNITATMMCAGYLDGGKDTCQGDSGGPYVIDNKLVGITSKGLGCGEANAPGIYTKVSYLRSYIDSVINPINFHS